MFEMYDFIVRWWMVRRHKLDRGVFKVYKVTTNIIPNLQYDWNCIEWASNSDGLEYLADTEEVGGSNPSLPTQMRS